jgi:4-hydroxy-tetrahydrodipicolinate reductase
MDTLPLGLTAICQRVDHISVTRVIDASTRRGPFQTKIGCGMTVEQFQAKMAAGRMGHVGLAESVAMVFHSLGRKLVRFDTTVEPLISDRLIKTSHVEVHPGQVKGLRQLAQAYSDEGEFMALTFVAALEASDEGDLVRITGKPDLEVRLKGTNGDIGTVAIVVNAIPRVRQAPPGLVTMADLPIVTAW